MKVLRIEVTGVIELNSNNTRQYTTDINDTCLPTWSITSIQSVIDILNSGGYYQAHFEDRGTSSFIHLNKGVDVEYSNMDYPEAFTRLDDLLTEYETNLASTGLDDAS